MSLDLGALKLPEEILNEIFSPLPGKHLLKCRLVSSVLKKFVDEQPKMETLYSTVTELKDKAALLKGIKPTSERHLKLLENIEDKAFITATVCLFNALSLPICYQIWNTPYVYPLAIVYKIVDLAYSPAYHIAAFTGPVGLMSAAAWVSSKVFLNMETKKPALIQQLKVDVPKLKKCASDILYT